MERCEIFNAKISTHDSIVNEGICDECYAEKNFPGLMSDPNKIF